MFKSCKILIRILFLLIIQESRRRQDLQRRRHVFGASDLRGGVLRRPRPKVPDGSSSSRSASAGPESRPTKEALPRSHRPRSRLSGRMRERHNFLVLWVNNIDTRSEATKGYVDRTSILYLTPNQGELGVGYKLLGMRNMVATFFCCRTRLVAIPVSSPFRGNDSRM